MRARLEGGGGAPAKGAVAMVGTWDPLLPAQRQVLMQLSRHAQARSLWAVAVVLHPPPPRFLQPAGAIWPEYTDLPTRLARLRECGLDRALVVHFRRRDLDAATGSFFDLMSSHVPLVELWLGAGQTLGRFEHGSHAGIAEQAARRGIALCRLEPIRAAPGTAEVRRLLHEGRVREAAEAVGHPPVWRRPRSGVLPLHWPPGRYQTVALGAAGPTGSARRRAAADADRRPGGGEAGRANAELIEVELTPGRRSPARLEWPRPDLRCLGVVAGPRDHAVCAVGDGNSI